jgi:response regulator RpfG family c-di-GMP phosphodiesterase
MNEKKKIKVLVVDDEEMLRDIVQRKLTRCGYTCFEAESGKNAQKMFDIEPVDLVISDLMMPEIDGIETIRRLKEKDPDLAAIIMTGYGTVENSVRAMKIGVSDFLMKPIDLEVLPHVVEAAMERRRLILENREYQKTLERQVEERTRHLSLSLQDLKRNFTDTIRAFTGLLERRDIHVGCHSKRVAVACREICKRFNLSESVHHDIEIGSLLHDIGKIVIPDEILKKSSNFFMRSKIDPKEEQIIRQHPVIGQESIEQIAILRSIGPIVRNHHEYFNGSGYPDGLSGDAIPIGARIVSVADVYDNIVNTVEQKRRNIAHTIAVKHLQKKAGELYDPNVVERFIDYLEKIRLQEKSILEISYSMNELQPGMILSRDILSKDGIIHIPKYDILDASTIDLISLYIKKKLLSEVIYVYEKAPESSPGVNTIKISGSSSAAIVADEFSVSFKKVKKAIDSTSNLSTLPSIYHSAMALISDPKSTKSDLVKLLKSDQAIVAKILRIVNSALFSFSRKVVAIEDAIPLLGLNEIQNIVISVFVIDTFGKQKSAVFDMSEFWKHSLCCAIISKLLAHRNKAQVSEEYFTAGLLHDIGKLVLNQLFPKELNHVIELTNTKTISFRNAERKVFGQPHTYVGKYLLLRWKIPDFLAEAVAYHHWPSDSKLNPVLTSTVQMADMFTHMLKIGSSGENTIPRFDEFALKNLDISLFEIEALVSKIESQVKENEDLLLLGS